VRICAKQLSWLLGIVCNHKKNWVSDARVSAASMRFWHSNTHASYMTTSSSASVRSALIVSILVLVAILYFRDANKVNAHLEILQVDPGRLTFEVLREKLPIVVHQASTKSLPLDIDKLIVERLKHTYWSYTRSIESGGASKDKVVDSRYVILSCDIAADEALVKIAYSENEDALTVKLSPDKNCLILPMYWKWSSGKSSVVAYKVHDIFSGVKAWWKTM
jgi:hypothetical protein